MDVEIIIDILVIYILFLLICKIQEWSVRSILKEKREKIMKNKKPEKAEIISGGNPEEEIVKMVLDK